MQRLFSKINQELMMEISELRNIMKLNKQVMVILSQNSPLESRHFYVMFKTMFLSYSDLCDYQMQLLENKAVRQIRIKQLEDQITNLSKSIVNDTDYTTQNCQNTNIYSKNTFQSLKPKRSNISLYDQLLKYQQQNNVLKQKISKLQNENSYLQKKLFKITQNTNQDNFSNIAPNLQQYQQVYNKNISILQLNNKIIKYQKINEILNSRVVILNNCLNNITNIKKKKSNIHDIKTNVLLQLIISRSKMPCLDKRNKIRNIKKIIGVRNKSK